MLDYIFLMHNDSSPSQGDGGEDLWGPYIAKLKARGCFEGGSSIGAGLCVNRAQVSVEVSSRLVGFIKVRAESLEGARELVAGNPVFEAGGTVEIRELPRS